MTRSRAALALSLLLTASFLLSSVHLKSFFGLRPVANRLHEARRPGPSRRLLTQERRGTTLVRESREERGPVVPLLVSKPATPLPLRVFQELSKPAYLQLHLEPQHPPRTPA